MSWRKLSADVEWGRSWCRGQGDQGGQVEGKELHFSTMDRGSRAGVGALDALEVFFSLAIQRSDSLIFTSQHQFLPLK